MKTLIGFALLLAFAYVAFTVATDRICTKPYSAEFKATQQYKNMQCPQ